MFENGSVASASAGEPEKFFGKYPGLVAENDAPADADHRGELLVEVPGILEESEDGGHRPIRVVARPCFMPGFFFIPEAGAQIWVEFVAGDINSPVWTGVWYPTDAVPQSAADDAPTRDQKVIRTRSGHVIQIDDSDDAERISITHQSRSVSIVLDEDGAITIEADLVRIKADTEIEGDLKVSGAAGSATTGSTTISGNEIKGGP